MLLGQHFCGKGVMAVDLHPRSGSKAHRHIEEKNFGEGQRRQRQRQRGDMEKFLASKENVPDNDDRAVMASLTSLLIGLA